MYCGRMQTEWSDRVYEKAYRKRTGNHTASPQRIIWGYGQLQPPCFEMLESIPGVEFYESGPDDIEKPRTSLNEICDRRRKKTRLK